MDSSYVYTNDIGSGDGGGDNSNTSNESETSFFSSK